MFRCGLFALDRPYFMLPFKKMEGARFGLDRQNQEGSFNIVHPLSVFP